MSDEGFHEIQLNGKQLVFLFMAATVVSVVIFLCGVMVGRGVDTSRSAAAGSAEPPVAELRAVESGASSGETRGTVDGPPPSDPPPAVETDYQDLLTASPQREPARTEQTPREAGAQAPARKPAPDPAAAKSSTTTRTARESPAAPAPAMSTADPAASSGYAVQLAALRERREADAIVRRLVGKGYQAYVLEPAPGAPQVYRVQVGRFSTRTEAERTAARLRKQEQFSPWVTR